MVFTSTLPVNTPALLSSLFINRKRYENYTIVLLKTLLEISNQNNSVFAYLVTQPSACYLYANYIDWIGPYIEEYLAENKKYQAYNVTLFDRVEAGEQAIKLWNIFLNKL